MASAQTEPSMDEILASIRRIISEEDDAPQEVPVRQKLETLQLKSADEAEEPEAQAEEAPKPRARAKKAEPKPEPEAEPEAEELQAEAGADDPEAEGGSDHVAEAAAQDELIREVRANSTGRALFPGIETSTCRKVMPPVSTSYCSPARLAECGCNLV